MVLPNISNNQKVFLKGNGLAKYGQKTTDFRQTLTPLQNVAVRYVKKMQQGVQRNIARKNQISSGNAYQTVGGGIGVDAKSNSALVYFTVPTDRKSTL